MREAGHVSDPARELERESLAMWPSSQLVSTAPGAHCHVFEWRASGRPVVLLHGLGSNAATWQRFIQDLDVRFRPLAVDLRGHGDSSWAPDYRIESFVRDLEALRDWLGRPFAIVGHSLGGEVALHFAARNPQSAHALVLVDLGAQMDSRGRQRIRESLAAAAGEYLSRETYLRELRESYVLAEEAALWPVATHGVRPSPAGRYTLKLDPRLRRRFEPSPSARHESELPDLWDALASIRCPTLVVRGAASAVLPLDGARRMASTLPLGRMEQIARAGHAVMLDNPAEFGAVASRFLGETLVRD